MSIKTVLDCIKNEFSQRKRSTQERIYNDKKIEERLRQIQFDDISESFPKEFFILDFDPLYSFYRIIRRRDVALFSSTCSKDSYLSGLLDNLFKEKEIGKKQLFFSDFSGVLNSKDSGKYSFADFKKEQFERNIFLSRRLFIMKRHFSVLVCLVLAIAFAFSTSNRICASVN